MRFNIPRPVAIAANFGVDDIESRLAGKIFEVLPAGLNRKARYTHPEGSPSGTWSGAFLVSKVLIPTRSARELHNQTFSHEVGAI